MLNFIKISMLILIFTSSILESKSPNNKVLRNDRQSVHTSYKTLKFKPYKHLKKHRISSKSHKKHSKKSHRLKKKSKKRTSIRSITRVAKSKLGKRYKWGGNGPYAYDCSGFTKEVFKKNGILLPRVSIKQALVGKKIRHRKQLKKGDLIFFTSRNHHKVDHVGIYLGHGKFIHASHFHHKVVISPLREYKRYFKWGRRLT